jgi:hypothetical protein
MPRVVLASGHDGTLPRVTEDANATLPITLGRGDRLVWDVRARFAALCDELVCPDGAATVAAEEWFEHVNKPDWGRGRVIRRFDDKIEIAFAAAGTKVLVASSPLLRKITG